LYRLKAFSWLIILNISSQSSGTFDSSLGKNLWFILLFLGDFALIALNLHVSQYFSRQGLFPFAHG
jgi:hypothetical protein